MVEVRLHGELAREFGKVWHVAIDTPREAVDAIDANRPGFRQKILDLAQRGMVFRVRASGHDYDNDDVNTSLGQRKRVDIIPIIVGASAGVRFVLGAVLVVAGIYFENPYLVSTGVTLMLGSVVQWLTPVPKKNQFDALQSWTVTGPTNTVDQGKPVPVIYGEVLTGGYTISAGLSADGVTSSIAQGTTAGIGGDVNLSATTNGSGSGSTVFQLSIGSYGLNAPLTYSWSVGSLSTFGTPGTATATISGQGTATIRLTVTYNGCTAPTKFYGTVNCTVHGQAGNVAGVTSAVGTATITLAVQP